MNREVRNKINKIDKLLNDDEYFKKYICEVESKYDFENEALKDRLLRSIKPVKKKLGFRNIVKIAACTVLAVLICEYSMTFDKDKILEDVTSKNENKTGFSMLYTNIQTKLNDINGIMLNPLKIERGENK